MRKSNLSAVLACSLVLLLPLRSSAFNLSDEFKTLSTSLGGMSSTVSPSSFRADSMSGYNFGSISMRTPVKKIELVRVQRASVSAGCHGVDINFGGMSFIQASEIVNQLKAIAKGAPALIYNMTLKAIAAPLVNALNELYDRMAELSSALKNSCEASQALVAGLEAGIKKVDGGWLSSAQNNLSEWGDRSFMEGHAKNIAKGASKWLDENASSKTTECMMAAVRFGLVKGHDSMAACGGEKATGSVADDADKIAQKLKAMAGWNEEAADLVAKADKGNTSWNTLQALGVAPSTKNPGSASSFLPNYGTAVLFQSMMGSSIFAKKADKGKVQNATSTSNDDREMTTSTIPSTMIASDFLMLFMCGGIKTVSNYNPTAGPLPAGIDPSDSNLEWAKEWCSEQLKMSDWQGNGLQVIHCKDMADARTWMGGCIDAEIVSLESFEKTNNDLGKGMLFSTMELLESAVYKAADGMLDFTPEERAIISMAPFPLYDVINIAAAAPTVAAQLIQANATVLAFYFSATTINSIFRSISMSEEIQGRRLPLLPSELSTLFFEVQDQLSGASAVEIAKLNVYKSTADMIMHQVKTINSEVLSSTMAIGINGTEFAESMSSLTAGG